MRTLIVVLCAGVVAGACAAPAEETAVVNPAVDIERELASIEETRSAFLAALKAGRPQDLAGLVTEDFRTVPPGAPEWNRMMRLSAERGTPFPYDSMVMRPQETVIVSDSVAWDFGVSSVYFTDENGEVLELQDTFLAILRKGPDGVWRLHREVASSRVD